MKINKKFEPIISGLSAAIVISALAFITLETSAGIWHVFFEIVFVFVLYELGTAQPKIFFWSFVSMLVALF